MNLPLRLFSEPIVRSAFKTGCFVLPTANEDLVCLVAADQGLIALVISKILSDKELAQIIGCSVECLPRLRLFCQLTSSTDQTYAWMELDKPIAHDAVVNFNHWAAAERQCICCNTHTCAVPRCLTEAMNRYYARQVLEPSIRGFLGILEKQFPRNDLYLFELLQNAVDDGACHVCFKAGPGGNGLEFFHNGRRFTALDVLGLASVGLSTKGVADGPKRTIGFMGVGFKAVYKRYASVQITDGRYGFRFTEPSSPRPNEPSHGWVLQPAWVLDNDPAHPFWKSRPSKLSADRNSERWCRFQLMKPRGGSACVTADLANLPRTVPPLLGRKSLENASIEASHTGQVPPTQWTLEWNGNVYVVDKACMRCEFYGPMHWERMQRARLRRAASDMTQTTKGKPTSSASTLQDHDHLWRGEMELFPLALSRSQHEQRHFWRFLTIRFIPDIEACKAYEMHTKKAWVGTTWAHKDCPTAMQKAQWEESSVFFEEGEDGCPLESRQRGCIHSVLPTKLVLPCGLQWQGPWLLSVDRQDIQSVSDNAWNACLLRQAPKLLQSLLACAVATSAPTASSELSTRRLKGLYALFPPLEIGPIAGRNGESLFCQIFNEKLDLIALTEFARHNEVVPCLQPQANVFFACGQDVLWLPANMVSTLPSDLVSQWAHPRHPFASNMLNDCTSWLALWQTSLVLPNKDFLLRHRAQFRLKFSHEKQPAARQGEIEDGEDDGESIVSTRLTGTNTAVTILAALQVALETDVTIASRPSGGTSQTTKDATDADTARQKWLAPLSDWPVFVAEDGREAFASELIWLSEDFVGLSPELIILLRAGAKLVHTHSKNLKLMHSNVEALLLTCNSSASENELARAQRCMSTARTLCSENVVTPEAACRALLSHWSKLGSISDAITDNFLVLAKWAKISNRHSALSHVLARRDDTPNRLFLLPSAAVRVGRLFGGDSHKDLHSFFDAIGRKASSMPVVDEGFLGNKASPAECTQWGRFLVHCGVRAGPGMSVSVRQLSQQDIQATPMLEKVNLRKNPPNTNLYLPYGLGAMNRKHMYELESHLDSQWLSLFSGMDVSAATSAAALFAALLARCEAADPITPMAAPAAAFVLSGKTDPEREKQGWAPLSPLSAKDGTPLSAEVAVPALKRVFFLPAGSAGAAALANGPADWLRKLASMTWIPAAVQGELPAVLRPCECLLQPQADASHMPVAQLPPDTIKLLLSVPAVVTTALAWGTVKPRPPIDRLEALTARMASQFVSRVNVLNTNEQPLSRCRPHQPSSDDYTELINLWRAICLAHRDGRLSASEQSRLARICDIPKVFTEPSYSANDSVLCASNPVLPGKNGQVFTYLMTVDVPWIDTLSTDVAAPILPADSECAAAALSRVGHLLCISDKESPLVDVAVELRSLLKPRRGVCRLQCVDFLRRHCSPGVDQYQFEANIPFQSSSVHQKFSCAYSWALALALCDAPAPMQALRRDVPMLQIICRKGPTARPDAHPSRWCSAYACLDGRGNDDSVVLPVFINDMHTAAPGCGIPKSSLLRPAHCVQPIALLDHVIAPFYTQTHIEAAPRRLADLDTKSLKTLRISRLTDADFSLRVAARGRGKLLRDSSLRLKIVILLLTLVRTSRNAHHVENQSIPKAPQILFFDTLHLVFSSPHIVASKAVNTEVSTSPSGEIVEKCTVFAVWGATSQRHSEADELSSLDHPKPLLVAGSAESYVAELEELVLSMVFGHHAATAHAMHSSQFSVTKVLRLLMFLQLPEKFKRFLLQDFGAFVPSDVGGTAPNLLEAASKELISSTHNVDSAEDAFLGADIEAKSAVTQIEPLDVAIQKLLQSTARECLWTGLPENISRDNQIAIESQSIDSVEQADSFLSRLGPAISASESNGSVHDVAEHKATHFQSSQSNADSCGDVYSSSIQKVVPDSAINVSTLEMVASRTGRGVSMLPAWMTAPGLGAAQNVPEEEQVSTVVNNTTKLTADTLDTIAGRSGRGISLLPAWMTAPGLGSTENNNDVLTAPKPAKPTETQDLYIPPPVAITKRALGLPLDEDASAPTKKARLLDDSAKTTESLSTVCNAAKDDAAKLLHNIYGALTDKKLLQAAMKVKFDLENDEELDASQSTMVILGSLGRLSSHFET